MFFFSLSDLVAAYEAGQAMQLQRRTDRQIMCPYCDKYYKTKYYLMIHVKDTHTNLPYTYECDQCVYKTNKFDNFQRHYKGRHGDKE